MEIKGSVVSPGNAIGRVRLFVGDGVAYLVHSAGYNTLSVTNPVQPSLIAQGSSAQNGWKQIVLNGSGLGLAVVGLNPPLDIRDNIYLYDTSQVRSDNLFPDATGYPGYCTSGSDLQRSRLRGRPCKRAGSYELPPL